MQASLQPRVSAAQLGLRSVSPAMRAPPASMQPALPTAEQRSGSTPRASVQVRSAPIAPATQAHHTPRKLPTHPDIGDVLFTSEVIQERVAELGRLIGQDYAGRELLVLGVLKGAFMFTADLVQHIYPYPPSLLVDFFKASSYGTGTVSSGEVKLDSGFDLASVQGKHVLLVEDIIDTGNTLSRLVEVMTRAGAESVRIVALLDKKARRKAPIEADYMGFVCPDAFIVGYGIDHAERFRNLPYIGVPRPEYFQRQ